MVEEYCLDLHLCEFVITFLIKIVTNINFNDHCALRSIILLEPLLVPEFDEVILQMIIWFRWVGYQKIGCLLVIYWKKLCSNDYVFLIIQRIKVVCLLCEPCKQHVLHPCKSQTYCTRYVFVFIAQLEHED